MNVTSKLQTAVQDPKEIPPYAYRQASTPVRRGLTWLRTRGLDRQKHLIDAVRERDEYLLVVLDACRWDRYRDHADGLFDQDMQPMQSEGHDTFQYISRCWPDIYPDVTYVSGATPVAGKEDYEFDDVGLQHLYDGYVPSEHIPGIVDAWDKHWDASVGTVPPEAVVGETLQRQDHEELVCHLFQPHAPYIGEPELLGHAGTESAVPGSGEPVDAPLWQRVRTGRIPTRELREAYRGNLERALDAVCWLLDETDREAVIIGDHGEALGELGVYSHPRKSHPKIRTVPYADVRGLTPRGRSRAKRARRKHQEADADTGGATGDVKEKLESLGYL